MNVKGQWTEEGNFLLVDADRGDEMLAAVTLHGPFKAQSPGNAHHIARAIVTAMVQTPHPDADASILRGS